MKQKELNETPINYDQTYMLRNVPDMLWRQFQAKCKMERKTAREVLIEKITEYIKERG